MSSTTSSTESRALTLLGQGLGPEVVAAAVGVSTSRISQLLSSPEFASAVAELRYKTLSKHNDRDAAYDSLEDQLVEKMKDLIPLMYKPFEVLKAIQVINSAKRRGASTPEAITGQQTVVPLQLPSQIVNIFAIQGSKDLTVNVHNQVVKAGAQELVTVQSSQMDRLLSKSKQETIENRVGALLDSQLAKESSHGNQTSLTIENSPTN